MTDVDANAACAAVLSHEAHLLRVLASPGLSLEDLGRAACVCRAWRAAVGRDDALFEAALRRDSPALAAARTALVSCRALAASTRAALKTPRSRAPAWARAAGQPEEWTLIVDLYDLFRSPGKPAHNLYSTALPLAAINQLDDDDGGDEWAIMDLCACARHVDAAAAAAPTLAEVQQEWCTGQAMTEAFPSTGDGFRHRLRLLALHHRSGKAAVICTWKKPRGQTTYRDVSDENPFALGTFSGRSSTSFEPVFGTGPRMRAHVALFPAPSPRGNPEVCVLGFSGVPLEKLPRLDGPDTDTESESASEGDEFDQTQQDVLNAIILGPLRWTP
jgi:hypothetical protein